MNNRFIDLRHHRVFSSRYVARRLLGSYTIFFVLPPEDTPELVNGSKKFDGGKNDNHFATG
jgi:hypothetical protein